MLYRAFANEILDHALWLNHMECCLILSFDPLALHLWQTAPLIFHLFIAKNVHLCISVTVTIFLFSSLHSSRPILVLDFIVRFSCPNWRRPVWLHKNSGLVSSAIYKLLRLHYSARATAIISSVPPLALWFVHVVGCIQHDLVHGGFSFDAGMLILTVWPSSRFPSSCRFAIWFLIMLLWLPSGGQLDYAVLT